MKRDYVGERFGNYQLVSLLGRGGFAAVYLGQHVRLKKRAAIKVLHTSFSPEEIAKFQREAEIVASLEHRNIVRLLDFDIAGDIPFLVIDYYPNGTLRQRHPKGSRLPLSTVIPYVKQVADALQFAHNRRLIHRDVKPENMLIGHDNDILLSDFGIAANAHNTSSMSVQAPMGTIPYMAPEQIQAQARPASDQYALAVVVYEWLTGERPFDGPYNEVFAKHLNMPPPSLRGKLLYPSSEIERVLFKALAKDPKQRFETVRAFAVALEGASQRTPMPQRALSSYTVPYLTIPALSSPNKQIANPPQIVTKRPDRTPTPTSSDEFYSSPPRRDFPAAARQIERQQPILQVQAIENYTSDSGKDIQPPISGAQPLPTLEAALKKSSSGTFGPDRVLESWGDLFKYSLPVISRFSDTLPLYIAELLIATGIVALWLGLTMQNWDWAIFGGSVGGSILLFLCGFIKSSFVKLLVASLFGVSWGLLLFMLYFALTTPAHITTPGFMLWFFGVISLALVYVGASIHCYLFKEVV